MMQGSGEEDTGTREHRFLVVGRAGNGKSSLCNTLTDSRYFATGRGLTTTTRTLQSADVSRHGFRFRVVDTPDVTNTNMSQQEMEAEVRRWREATSPFPTAVLLTVRCDVRYTAEEYAIYREIQKLWGDNSLRERLVVAFTFGDRQDAPLEEELKAVCPELKGVLRDAGQRYVMFSDKATWEEKEQQVLQLIKVLETSSQAKGTAAFCHGCWVFRHRTGFALLLWVSVFSNLRGRQFGEP
ncbi:GTPase IMAP family member 9-like [Babylonia areolata]|uniref:GTPase IMAP family member 9-like n=1 Tax=Babylonia areolata TaxID=304850 RepID=UPI003FD29350